jgi:hypothetical protein
MLCVKTRGVCGNRPKRFIQIYATAVINNPAIKIKAPVGVEYAIAVLGCVERRSKSIQGAAADI